MNIWIEGARFKTLIASLSPVFIGGVIAFDQKSFSIRIFIACIKGTMFLSQMRMIYREFCASLKRLQPETYAQNQAEAG